MSTDQPTIDLPANLAAPAVRALTGAGYTQLDQIARTTATDLLKLHGVGPKTIRQLREALAERGQTLPD